jgi:hypothetical protein
MRSVILMAVVFLAACSDAVSPGHGLRAPGFAAAGTGGGITLDQMHGTLSESGMHIGNGFGPVNPHLGDAIVATFFWAGANTITTVTDHLCDTAPQPSGYPGTPVGNAYTLVEYVSAGGISMATYVATNVRNFPDPNPDPTTALCVHAIFAAPVTDGGVLLSAWSGVSSVSAQALGAHHSAAGLGTTTTVADPGAIPIGAGALALGVTMSNAMVGADQPPGFTTLAVQSDNYFVDETNYLLAASAGSVDPQWTWFFNAPSTWLASAFVLNPAALHLGFTAQPHTTLPFTTIAPPVQVTVLDDLGNPVSTFNGPVSIAIGHNGGLLLPGTLSGTKTVNAVNGVATFSDLSIDQPGNGYTLVVSGAGVTGAESAAFDIGAF